MIQGISKILISLFFVCLVTNAHAIPVNFSIEGTVNSTSGMNPFGLSVGDSVFANATFDDSFINVMGSSEVEFGMTGNAFGSSLAFNIGSLSFSESSDVDFDDIFPTLNFNDGLFIGFDYVGNIFETFGLGFSGFNAGIENLQGSWNADSATITPVTNVPEPSSMLLLGLGVIGLLGFSRKEKT